MIFTLRDPPSLGGFAVYLIPMNAGTRGNPESFRGSGHSANMVLPLQGASS